MAALTANRVSTANVASNPQSALQKGSTTCYLGAIICLDSSGYGKPGVTGTGLIGVGRCIEYSANTGADGAVSVKYEEGTFGPFDNSGTSIAVGDEGKPCYIVDDQTVHLTDGSSTRSPAGRVHSVTSKGVFVVMSRAIAREIVESQIVSTGQVYTQTYSTANRTVANPTGVAVSATLTDSTGLSGTHDDTLAATAVPADLTDNSGGAAADGTIGVITTTQAITDSSGGTAGAEPFTIAAITTGGAAADQGPTRDALAKLTAAMNTNRTAIIACRDAIAELATKVNAALAVDRVIAQNVSDVGQKAIELVTLANALVADDLDNRQTITALVDDLQTADIVD